MIEPFFFDPAELASLADRHRPAYLTAAPFPHVVLDGLIPEDVTALLVAEFPAPHQGSWLHYDSSQERKLESTDQSGMGAVTRQLLAELNSSTFVAFLERLTGIPSLIPDPHLEGGGQHQIERGGYLKIHADFNRHPRLDLERRLNLLLYLNRDWTDEYGGHLELWDGEMRHCVQRILPVFNRCVVFSTTPSSYHGHPDPLTCPDGITRRSLALYYYTAASPSEAGNGHHGTLFQARPGEETEAAGSRSTARIASRLLPPAAIELVGRLRDPVSRKVLARRLLPPAAVDRISAARRGRRRGGGWREGRPHH
jgi:hypothetical protein